MKKYLRLAIKESLGRKKLNEYAGTRVVELS